MSDLLSQIVLAVIVPTGALAVRYMLQRSTETQKREYIVEMPDGRKQYVEVEGQSQAAISKVVLREYELEERVFDILRGFQERGDIQVERGRDVDFVILGPDGTRTGIDIKTQFGKHAFKEIDQFKTGKLSVQRLILLVFGKIEPRVIRQTTDLVDAGRLKLESIPDPAALEMHLAALLQAEKGKT
jgi:hypothetical protein